MIFSETITIVYSEVINNQVFSEDDPDYRRITNEFRETEQDELRDLEDGNKRLLE
jgi:hypothetical protein